MTTPLDSFIASLREAARLEHAAVISYLFAAYSVMASDANQAVKIAALDYRHAAGNTLLSISIQEMIHLAMVNQILAELREAPEFAPPSLPMKISGYQNLTLPLAPLSDTSLAVYTLWEAPSVFNSQGDDVSVVEELKRIFPWFSAPAKGSIYTRLIEAVTYIPEFSTETKARLQAVLQGIETQGSDTHYKFFRSLWLGTGRFRSRIRPDFTKPTVWQRNAPSDNGHPAQALTATTAATIGDSNTALIVTTNCTYELMLQMMHIGVQFDSQAFMLVARRLMTDIFHQLCTSLAAYKFGFAPSATIALVSPRTKDSALQVVNAKLDKWRTLLANDPLGPVADSIVDTFRKGDPWPKRGGALPATPDEIAQIKRFWNALENFNRSNQDGNLQQAELQKHTGSNFGEPYNKLRELALAHPPPVDFWAEANACLSFAFSTHAALISKIFAMQLEIIKDFLSDSSSQPSARLISLAFFLFASHSLVREQGTTDTGRAHDLSEGSAYLSWYGLIHAYRAIATKPIPEERVWVHIEFLLGVSFRDVDTLTNGKGAYDNRNGYPQWVIDDQFRAANDANAVWESILPNHAAFRSISNQPRGVSP